MARFCTECGRELEEGHVVCVHCGTRYTLVASESKQSAPTSPTPALVKVEKTPMSKKQKVILSTMATILIAIIGVNMWAKSYQSVEAVEARYMKALMAEDTRAIKKLGVHSDGSQINMAEAQAHVKLVNHPGYADLIMFYEVEQHGRFLLFFDAYKVKFNDQYLIYSDPIDGLTFTFNGEKALVDSEDEAELVYGPLVPGIYDVTISFKMIVLTLRWKRK